MHIVDPRQQALYWRLHIGVQVYRINKGYLWKAAGAFGQGLANAFKAVAKVFPAVAGHQDHALPLGQEGELAIQRDTQR